jgi:uroporphyrinogen-III synthase
MVKRLGLARTLDDALSRVVAEAGWEPVPVFLTKSVPTGAPRPTDRPDGVVLLSPAGARVGAQAGALPEGVPILVTGPGTAEALPGREVLVSAEPNAEGLWRLLQASFPSGGTFLLVRGERSRGHLEEISAGTPWRLVPWITYAEKAKEPLPELPPLEGVLALSPLQAELLGPRAEGLLRFAWGARTAEAFQCGGYPAHDSCLARPEALGRMLAAYV